ncbi:MAG: hypothetical protein QGI45_09265 [Myxococcota bacterium]|jgi:protein-disulfide isomerase|nr:hypothetical protein [Myxococcota bacterium]
MSKNLTLLVGLAIGLGVLSGCVSRADIEDIKATQKDILAKIDKIKAAPAAPAKPQRRPGPDPKTVYAFPAGDSAAKGPADALVTIIEVSDFQ